MAHTSGLDSWRRGQVLSFPDEGSDKALLLACILESEGFRLCLHPSTQTSIRPLSFFSLQHIIPRSIQMYYISTRYQVILLGAGCFVAINTKRDAIIDNSMRFSVHSIHEQTNQKTTARSGNNSKSLAQHHSVSQTKGCLEV